MIRKKVGFSFKEGERCYRLFFLQGHCKGAEKPGGPRDAGAWLPPLRDGLTDRSSASPHSRQLYPEESEAPENPEMWWGSPLRKEQAVADHGQVDVTFIGGRSCRGMVPPLPLSSLNLFCCKQPSREMVPTLWHTRGTWGMSFPRSKSPGLLL